ncbi:hypothetical protein BH11MYX3_BH11MYX3_32340 [soil metagenome]
MGQMTDAELVQASRRGERAAFGALVERYQGVVCAVSFSRTGDRALSEDVAQETFLAAWRQLDRLRETVKLRSWLCGIARNLARKARKRSDRETTLEGEMVAPGDSPFDEVCDAEGQRVLRDAMSRVPETYREPLVLHYAEGLSVREIAEILELSEAAVMQRLSRGRQVLADGVDGVNDLVERALRSQRTRRSLVAAVLAALPSITPSPVEASTRSHGGHMLKLALIVGGLAVTGTTTAFLVHHQRSSASPPVTVAAMPMVAGEAVSLAPPVYPPPAAVASHRVTPPQPALPQGEPSTPAPVDRATLQRLALDHGPSRGPADAPVTIVMFTDAMCKYCGNVLATIDEVWDEFPGQLRLVVKQFPVHSQAVLAAEASLAAAAQDRYWQFHEQMFANPDDLSHDALIEDAQRAGLDVATFRAALDQHTYAAALAAEQAAAKEIDISATPSFLINGKHFIGARPAADLRAEIVAALAP